MSPITARRLDRFVRLCLAAALALQAAPAYAQAPGQGSPNDSAPGSTPATTSTEAATTSTTAGLVLYLPIVQLPAPAPYPYPDYLPAGFGDQIPRGAEILQAEPDAAGAGEHASVGTGDTAVLFQAGAVAVIAPAGAFTEAVTLNLKPLVTAAAGVGPEAAPRRFTVEARQADSGQAITHFERPVKLLVDLRGQGLRGDWYLAYQDAVDPDVWHRPEITVHDPVGLISVETDHFSAWAAGAEPSAWQFKPNLPAASEFSGAATYSLPVEVPAGRGGLTPSVALSYSSRGVDGLITASDQDQGPLGLGWSLGGAEVVRRGVHTYCCWQSGPVLVYPDLFTLSLGGQSYDLFPEAGIDTASAPLVRYYAQNGPALWVQRVYAPEAANQDKLYWIVKTGDGTTYRLGYTADAEVVQSGGTLALSGHAGAPGVTALRWQVDLVTDTSGNQLQYRYENWPKLDGALNTEGARPDEIRYNFTAPAVEALTPVAGDFLSRIVFVGGDNHRLTRIDAYHLDRGRPVRSVDIRLDGLTYLGCGAATTTQTVSAVQVTGADGVSRLPATTFTYAPHRHHGSCYPFAYLRAVDNGYGGRVQFTYSGDGREAVRQPGESQPAFGQAYFVSKIETWDGVAAAPAVTTYTYEAPCYNLKDGPVGPLAGATRCLLQDAATAPGVAAHFDLGGLVGFLTTTVTVQSQSGIGGLTRSVTTFGQARLTVGRPLRVQTLGWDGGAWAPLRETATAYTAAAIPGGGAQAAQPRMTITTSFDGGEVVTARRDLAAYDRYGNLLEIIDYDAHGQPYRSTRRRYEFNTAGAAWITTALTREQVFARQGSGWAEQPARETRYDYNTDASPATTAPDARGWMTATRRWSLDPATGQARFVDTRLSYDRWGNIVTATTYNSYGTESAYAAAEPRVTGTTFDPAYGLYPVRQTNPLGHATTLDLDFRLGLPLTITDANGVATHLRYDAFGRLTLVIRPGDSEALPTVRHIYRDGGTPSQIETRQRVTSGCADCERVLVAYYDGLGRTIQVRVANSGGRQTVTNTTYDALGRAAASYLPVFETTGLGFARPAGWEARPRTRTEFDGLGRAVRVTAADGAVVQTSIRGLRTALLDAHGHQRLTQVDVFGRTAAVFEYDAAPGGTVDFERAPYAATHYTYDVADQLVQVATLSSTTTIAYDALGRKTALDDPDLGAWTYAYEPAGNLAAQTDARGVVVAFTYDALGRPLTKRYSVPTGQPVIAPDAVAYHYDEGGAAAWALGRRTRLVDGTGTTTWTFDARGRVNAETRALTRGLGTYAFQRAYNAADEPIALTYPDGEVVATALDEAGLPTDLTSSLGLGYVTDASYDVFGRPLQVVLGNGLSTRSAYYAPTDLHQGGRLQSLTVGDGLLDLAFVYDAGGNITRLEDRSRLMASRQTQQFQYDALDRLIAAQTLGGASGAYAQTFAYDELGRLVARTEADTTLAYTYADPAHLHAATRMGAADTYAYDPNGNMTTRLEAGVTYTQTWTAENRLARVTWVEAGRAYTTTFGYDGDGGRTLKIDDDGKAEITTVYVGGLFEKQIDTTAADLSAVFGRLAADTEGATRGRPGLARAARRDYTGPGTRTATVWVPPAYSWGPAQVAYQPWIADCANKPADPAKGTECGYGTGLGYDAASCSALGQWPCQDGERFDGPDGHSEDVTYNPATASASLNCTFGLNGWCRSVATLTLTGAEPMPGESIVGLSTSFLNNGAASQTVGGATRVITIAETAPVTYYYWAESSHGDQSVLGQVTAKVDGTAPAIELAGPSIGVWYAQATPITITLGDSLSGPRCVRAAWNTAPLDDPNCATTTVTVHLPSEGSHMLHVRAWDQAGNVAVRTATYQYDATPPASPTAASSACAADNVWQSACGAPSFTWPAAFDAVSGVERYERYWGPSSTGTATTTTAAASYSAGSTNEGVTYLRLRAVDRAGNVSAWATVFTFRYDATPPVTSLALAGNLGADDWFRSAVTATLTAVEPLSGLGVTQWRLDGGAWQDAAGPVSVAGTGVHLLEFRSRDGAGNWEAPESRQVKVDREPPSLAEASATEDSGAAVQTGQWQGRVDRPRFSWRGLTDSPADQLTGYRVYWGPDPDGIAPFEDSATAAYTVTQPVASGAELFLRVQARDAAGNWSAWATLFDFRFDNAPPLLNAWLPADGAVLTTTRPVVTAAFADAGPGSGLADPVLVVDQQIVTPTLAAGALTYVPEEPLAPGPHTLILYLADQAGNETVATRRFIVDPETRVRFLAPADGAVLNARAQTVVVAGEPGAAVTATVGSRVFTHTLDASGRWEIPAVELSDGDNALMAAAEDSAGNTASHAVTVTVDLTSDVALVSAERAAFNPAQAPALFSVTALAGGGRQVLSWSLAFESEADTIATLIGTQPAERQPVVWDGRLASGDLAPDGVYTAHLTVTTTGGRVTRSAALPITLVSGPPTAPALECGPDGETWFSQPPALARGTAQDGAQVVVYQDGLAQFVVPVFNGRWQQPIALAQGAPFSTTVTARALDAAGNLSVPSAACRLGLTQADPFIAPHAAVSSEVIGRDAAVTLTATTRAVGAPLTSEGVQVALPEALGAAPTLTRVAGTGAADVWSGVWQLPAVGHWEAPVTIVFSAVDTAQPAPNRGLQFVQPYLDLVPPYARLVWPWAGYAQTAAVLAPQGVAEPFGLVTVTAVRVSDGLTLTALAEADASGAWAAALTLPDGRYALSVQAQDRAGNNGPASEPIVITIDTTGPALQSPVLWPAYVGAQSELTVTVGVTDALSVVADVRLQADDLPRQGETITVDLTLQAGRAAGVLAIAQDADEGLKPVAVYARDALDNSSVMTGAAIVVDKTPPILSDPALIANGAWLVITGTAAYYGPQTQGRMMVAVTAEDASATHTTAGLETLAFPALFGAPEERRPLDGARASLTYTRTYTVTGTTNGAFPVLVTDRAGNSADRALTLHYDAAPPTVTVSLPPAAGLRFSVGWAAVDQGAGLAAFDVQYRDASDVAWTAWLTATTVTSSPFLGQAGHSYLFRVRATDQVGNVSGWQTATSVVTDVIKYYTFGGQRLAMRQGLAVYFIHGDHLGSAALVTDAAGAVVAETRYLPYGLERASAGASPTDFSFTGQRQDSFGLLDYNARFYAPRLGQFISADTLVPGADNPQLLNRYAYVGGNPIRYTDSTGHCIDGVSTLLCIVLIGAAAGAVLDFTAQVYHQYHENGGDLGAAVMKVDPVEVAVSATAGAALAFSAATLAPVALTVAGDALAGAGLASGSTSLFSAGMSTYSTSAAVSAAVYGVSSASQTFSTHGGSSSGTPLAGNPNRPRLTIPPGRYFVDGDWDTLDDVILDDAIVSVRGGDFSVGGSVMGSPGTNSSVTASGDMLIAKDVIGNHSSVTLTAGRNMFVGGDVVGRDKITFGVLK